LTNDGTGKAEWKAKGAGTITLNDVQTFTLSLIRKGGLKTVTTPTTYQYCALSRIDAEMGRVNAGSISGAYCEVSKNNDGSWKLSGYLADDPDFTCKMTCFK
jgi:hypothetical protein